MMPAMHTITRCACLSLLLVSGLSVTSLAQIQDTVGSVDSLVFGSVDAAPGRTVAVPVFVTNDLELVSLTIPVAYPKAKLTADSVTFSGGRAAHFDLLTAALDTAAGRVLLGLTQLSGVPMPPGYGTVAWVHFTVSSLVVPVDVAVVDTGYFNDPGKLLFIGGPGGSDSYLPAVVSGQVSIKEANHPPVFFTSGSRALREGDSLVFRISAGDLDGDTVQLALLNRPPGAELVSLGKGEAEFAWQAPFTGPFSATGSPHTLIFAADDGEDVTRLELPLYVVNVNRPPTLWVPDTVESAAFDSVQWEAVATDPDLDPINISLDGLPAPAQVAPGNPLQIQWMPMQADTGTYPITITASDPNGGSTQMLSVLRISPGERVTYLMDTVSGYTGAEVVLQVHLENRETLTGIELLLNLDPTAATLIGIDRQGTRIESWEMFAVTQNFGGRAGDVHILARADINDGFPTPALPAGEGAIVNVRLRLSSDEAFAGLSFPARFVFRTAMANTATDVSGTTILQDEIAYSHGEVQISAFEDKLIGDINLNGLAYEVGDVVYFANYFSNPSTFPLNFEQRANSDVNGDGTPATIADLVYMIQVITNGGTPRLAPIQASTAWWSIDSGGALHLHGTGTLGGLVVVLETASSQLPRVGPAAAHMTAEHGTEGRLHRMVMYSTQLGVIEPGTGAVLEHVAGARVVRIDAADAAGHTVLVQSADTRPQRVNLLGNYPNPFNPETAIQFALDRPGDVLMEIYNVLGLKVRTLSGNFSAGVQELVWDGRDAEGRPAGSGVYFYKLVSDDSHQVRRMLLLK